VTPAELLASLPEGAAGCSLYLPQADGDWLIVAHDMPLKRRRAVARAGYNREEAALIAAAPALRDALASVLAENERLRELLHTLRDFVVYENARHESDKNGDLLAEIEDALGVSIPAND